MAQRRMISKGISTSRKVNKLSYRAALLYTWMIPHTDDYGRLEGDALSIRAKVAPMWKISQREIEKDIRSIEEVGLITCYDIKKERYLQIVGFENHQTFRSDRPRVSNHPDPKGVVARDEMNSFNGKVYKRDGYKCRYCGAKNTDFEIDHVVPLSRGGEDVIDNMVVACHKCNQVKGNKLLEELDWDTTDIPQTDKGVSEGDIVRRKISEDKIIEDKREKPSKPENSIKYLSKISKKDIKEWMLRFVVTEDQIIEKGEALKLWCETNGRFKKNYRSFLLNAIKKDFAERKKKTGKYSDI